MKKEPERWEEEEEDDWKDGRRGGSTWMCGARPVTKPRKQWLTFNNTGSKRKSEGRHWNLVSAFSIRLDFNISYIQTVCQLLHWLTYFHMPTTLLLISCKWFCCCYLYSQEVNLPIYWCTSLGFDITEDRQQWCSRPVALNPSNAATIEYSSSCCGDLHP